MNAQPKGPICVAILIIAVGVGWLLTAQGIGDGINWVWTLGLGVSGVLIFVVSGGVNKSSIVSGPFLIIGSVLSILRQSGRLSINLEVPILVITIGVLFLIAQLPLVPPPRWYFPKSDEKEEQPV